MSDLNVENRNLIAIEQIAVDPDLKLTLDQLLEKVQDIDPDDFRKIYDLITIEDLDEELRKTIEEKKAYDDTELRNKISLLEGLKANKSDLDKYRRKIDLIMEVDLDEELKAKINAISNGYDDRWVKQQIELLKELKMDKADGILFRRVDTAITLEDLDDEITGLLELISILEIEVNALHDIKADKAQLKNYRHKNIKISLHDLDDELRIILDNYVKYDDSKILLLIKDLQIKKADRVELELKADKTELDKYRLKDVPISMEDLDEELHDKIVNIPEEFDPSILEESIKRLEKQKADREFVDKYFRRKTVFIKESDLDPMLLDKINANTLPYDDRGILEAINFLETHKVDNVNLANYRMKEEEIQIEDLTSELQLKLKKLDTLIGDIEAQIKASETIKEINKRLDKIEGVQEEFTSQNTYYRGRLLRLEQNYNEVDSKIRKIKSKNK